jgi:hypothetical protein
MKFALQSVIASLPKAEDASQVVSAVKEENLGAFLRIWFGSGSRDWLHRFSCPALPYPILVSPRRLGQRDGRALVAYLDLMESAEYALPTGGSFRDPLNRDIWSDVLIGGTYTLSPSMEEVHVLVDLRGQERGYLVERCWIADAEEFAEFRGRLREWQRALSEYYDVYE